MDHSYRDLYFYITSHIHIILPPDAPASFISWYTVRIYGHDYATKRRQHHFGCFVCASQGVRI